MIELASTDKRDWESTIQHILGVESRVLDVERVSFWTVRDELGGEQTLARAEMRGRRGGHLTTVRRPVILRVVAQRNLKEQLVEAGYRLLFEKGFHAVSVNDIAADAGVPKGSFYNHFESKEALALEVVRRYATSYDTEALRSDDGPPLERLREHFEAIIGRTVTRGVTLGCMLGNFSTELSPHSPAIREYVAGALKHWSEAIASCLAQAQAAGQLAPSIEPQALGHYLVDAYEGAVARAKVSGNRAPLDTFLAMTFDVLLPARGGKGRARA